MNILKDTFGRKFPYIRLSISDVCNFKCGYCLPNGYKIDKSDNRTFITKEEIGRLAKALSELGVSKIRITGGEPTVRKDFLDIIKIIKKNSGIKKTVITTNGYHLNRIADDLNESGLDGINISIDSLDPETFRKITGHDRLNEILEGIKKLQKLNFKNIKVNAVLLKGVNDKEEDFKSWANFIKDNQIGAYIDDSSGKRISFEAKPFMGIIGVAKDTSSSVHSVPPGNFGGNLDINDLGIGSTLYLPVQVKGALFYTGDPHLSQGDGEVALTALEQSLRVLFRITLIKKESSSFISALNLKSPFGETKEYWIPIGLNEDLDEAMKMAVRQSINFLSLRYKIQKQTALAYLSAATTFEVSQVVDKTKGVHSLIKKSDFED